MAAVVYGVTLLLIRLLFAALSAYVRRAHLRGPGVEDPDLTEARSKFRFAVGGYVVTILLSLGFRSLRSASTSQYRSS